MQLFPLVLIKAGTKINFIKQRYIAYALSLLVTIFTVIALFSVGLNFGIDFTGGIIIEVGAQNNSLSPDSTRELLNNMGYHGTAIQNDDKGNIIIRLQPKNDTNYVVEIEDIKNQIIQSFPDTEFRKVDYVGPKVGNEMIYKGIFAVLASLVAMMIYVTIRFNWIFGLGVVIALFHDMIVTMGFYIVARYEFDLTSIAAILTIIGYSVNDSVVIYDRIRENIRKHPKTKIADLINLSVNETLSRTVMTVATTLVVCIALVAFGGPALRGFSAAILFGIAFGTYSSIYISAPILMLFSRKQSVEL